MNKKFFFLAVGIVVVICGCVSPLPEGLNRESLITLSLFGFVIVSLIGDVFPRFIATLVAMILLYLLGVADSLSAVWESFVGSVFFFLLAAFALSAVVKKSSIPLRLMGFFLKLCKGSSRMMILAFMVVTAIISAFMSDLAACALATTIILPVLDKVEMPRRFVRSLMIAVPIAALTGGFSTPIGSPSNITIMALLEDFNMHISFGQWLSVGAPMSILVLFISWGMLCVCYRPEMLDEDAMGSFKNQFGELKPFTVQDIKSIVLILAMMIAWVSTTWIWMLDSTSIAVIGLCIMFLPGVELLTFDEFSKEVPWDMVFMLCGLMAMASFLNSTGALDWVVSTIMADAKQWSPLI